MDVDRVGEVVQRLVVERHLDAGIVEQLHERRVLTARGVAVRAAGVVPLIRVGVRERTVRCADQDPPQRIDHALATVTLHRRHLRAHQGPQQTSLA